MECQRRALNVEKNVFLCFSVAFVDVSLSTKKSSRRPGMPKTVKRMIFFRMSTWELTFGESFCGKHKTLNEWYFGGMEDLNPPGTKKNPCLKLKLTASLHLKRKSESLPSPIIFPLFLLLVFGGGQGTPL